MATSHLLGPGSPSLSPDVISTLNVDLLVLSLYSKNCHTGVFLCPLLPDNIGVGVGVSVDLGVLDSSKEYMIAYRTHKTQLHILLRTKLSELVATHKHSYMIYSRTKLV